MNDHYWKPLLRPHLDDRVYHTLYEGSDIVYELRKSTLWVISASKNVFVGYRGSAEQVLLQLCVRKDSLVCSEHDCIISRTRAHARLRELGMEPQDIITAGLQNMHPDLRDSFRRSLGAFVKHYFSNEPLDKPAQDI